MEPLMRFLFLCLSALLALAATAQPPASLQDILQERLRKMEAERDRSERAYLELQAETRPKLQQLTAEKESLQSRLAQLEEEQLLLDSARQTTGRAGELAQQSLQEKQQELDAVQARLLEQQQQFAETLNALRQQQDARLAEQTQSLTRDLESAQTTQASLREQLQSLQDQMAQTEQTAETLRAEKTSLEQEARDIQGLNRQLNNDLEDSRRRESLANAQLLALQTRVEDLQDQLQKAFEDRSRAEQERDQLALRVNDLESQVNEFRENSVPRAEAERLQQALESSQAANQALQDALEEEQNRPDLSGELARTQRDRDLLDAQLKTLQTKVREAEALAAREQARFEESRAANASLVEHIARLESSRESLQAERDQQAGAIATLLDQQTKFEADLTSMASELEQARAVRAQYESLQQDYLSLQTEFEGRLEQSKEQSLAIADLQRALGASVQEIERSRRELETLKARQVDPLEIRAERANFDAFREKSRRDLRILANHIQRLRQDIADQSEIRRQLQTEREVLLRRLRELEAQTPAP